jgi:hypothetical protein
MSKTTSKRTASQLWGTKSYTADFDDSKRQEQADKRSQHQNNLEKYKAHRLRMAAEKVFIPLPF